MRIGIDATSVWGLGDGLLNGMIAYTAQLTKNLVTSDRENSYFVYCRGEIPEIFADCAGSATFIPLSSSNRKLLMQWTLPRAAKNDGIDVLFFPYNSAALFSSIPWVVTIHDLHPFVVTDRFKRIHDSTSGRKGISSQFNQAYWKWILRQSCARSTRVIAVSQKTKSDIVEIFGTRPDKIDVVHEAADHDRFNMNPDSVSRLEFLERYDLPDRYILVVGTHAYKNIEGILSAYRHAVSKGLMDVGLVIAGNKAWLGTDDVELIATGAGASRIVLTGFFPDADLKYLYQFADLFLFPSFYEGFGLPILEAFSCGTPVITSNTGAMPEVAGEAAILVDPNNHVAIAEQLITVLNDAELRKNLANAGRDRARDFSWSKAAAETRGSLVRAAVS